MTRRSRWCDCDDCRNGVVPRQNYRSFEIFGCLGPFRYWRSLVAKYVWKSRYWMMSARLYRAAYEDIVKGNMTDEVRRLTRN